jgi:nucleotide-binding universal stress UspA family protein
VSRIIVGLDGSSSARRAVEVGVDEAKLRGRPLVLVNAWSPPMVSTPYPIAYDPYTFEEPAQKLVDEAAAEIRAGHPELTVETVLVQSDARDALMSQLEADDLLVIGTRGLGGVLGLVLGSVASYCIRNAPCPVIVVPSPPSAPR